MPLDHVSLLVPESDVASALELYLAALAPLGYGIRLQFGPTVTGLGPANTDESPDFWIIGVDNPPNRPSHIAFRAKGELDQKKKKRRDILTDTGPRPCHCGCLPRRRSQGRGQGQRRTGHPSPLPPRLLRRLRPRCRWEQHRGRVPQPFLRCVSSGRRQVVSWGCWLVSSVLADLRSKWRVWERWRGEFIRSQRQIQI